MIEPIANFAEKGFFRQSTHNHGRSWLGFEGIRWLIANPRFRQSWIVVDQTIYSAQNRLSYGRWIGVG